MNPASWWRSKSGPTRQIAVAELYSKPGYLVEGPFADFGARPRVIVLRRPQEG